MNFSSDYQSSPIELARIVVAYALFRVESMDGITDFKGQFRAFYAQTIFEKLAAESLLKQKL